MEESIACVELLRFIKYAVDVRGVTVPSDGLFVLIDWNGSNGASEWLFVMVDSVLGGRAARTDPVLPRGNSRERGARRAQVREELGARSGALKSSGSIVSQDTSTKVITVKRVRVQVWDVCVCHETVQV